MDNTHHSIRGEVLVGTLMDDYKELLSTLGERGGISETKLASQIPARVEKQVQTILQRMQSSIRELRMTYNMCHKDLHGVSPLLFEVPKGEDKEEKNDTSSSSLVSEKAELRQILQEKNRQLKGLIDSIRDLLWYADVYPSDAE